MSQLLNTVKREGNSLGARLVHMTKYARHVSPKQTPQAEQARPDQVQNNAGGWAFKLDDWARLDRWLVLGAEGGTYYASEKKLTQENAKTISDCLGKDGKKTVERIAEMSESGRAPKNDPAIFALAMAAASDDAATRALALEALPRVCRTGTHLFQFAQSVSSMRGWGRGLRSAIGRWYSDKSAASVAYQAIKYQQRNGWSHRDLLRLSHPVAQGPEHDAVFRYIVTGETDTGKRVVERKGREAASYDTIPAGCPALIHGYEAMKKAKSVKEVVGLIEKHRMTHEMVTNDWKGSPDVWAALLQHMPMTAMIRNLGKMTSIGLIGPLSNASKRVIDALDNVDALKKDRVHPITLLSALRTYESNHGVKGSLTWRSDANVVAALERAFYSAFKAIEPTNKRIMLGLDVSGSMGCGEIAGVAGLTPRDAAAVMAMVTMRTEKQHYLKGFSGHLVDVPINERMRLHEVSNTMSRIPFGSTDCSLPMTHALQNKVPVDAFYVYTDSETWFGRIHPYQALRQYRDKMGIPARLVVIGLTSGGFTIADPKDGGMLDVVGFDSAAPSVMADFTR